MPANAEGGRKPAHDTCAYSAHVPGTGLARANGFSSRPGDPAARRWTNGNRAALEELIPVVYPELRRIAARYLRRERVGHTPPTALVHEAYVKLQDRAQSQNRAQFFGVAAQLMRRILVDLAREHAAEKQDAVSSEVAPQQLPEHSDYARSTGKCLLQPKDERIRGQVGEHVETRSFRWTVVLVLRRL